ncbi:MAG: hypothetical protein R6X25_08675 [Candidatus Krumholzibacteriia bacterium]
MGWTTLAQMLHGQGVLFWAGAGAIAAGATLLVVAVSLQLRAPLERVAGRLLRIRIPARACCRVAVAPPAAVTATDPRDTAPAAPPPRVPVGADHLLRAYAAGASGPSLRLLHQRLRAAADRLEAVSAALREEAADPELKTSAPDVEYVFRARA